MELSEWFCVNCKGAMLLLFCENSGERVKLVCVFIYLRLFLSLITTAVTGIFFSSGKERKLTTWQFLASLTKYKKSFSCHISRSFHSVICIVDDNSMCHIQLHHTNKNTYNSNCTLKIFNGKLFLSNQAVTKKLLAFTTSQRYNYNICRDLELNLQCGSLYVTYLLGIIDSCCSKTFNYI